MLVKTEAIVLHSLKFGETRLIVDLFTREAGRLSCIIPLPKTPKSRLKKQYFQPMTLLEAEIDLRQRLQLQKMKDARLLSAYVSIPFSPEKLALSLFTAEFLYHALRSEQQNEPLFAYICDSMQWLDTVEVGFANFHLTFLMRLSRFLGFYPNLDDYVDGCVFDMRAANIETFCNPMTHAASTPLCAWISPRCTSIVLTIQTATASSTCCSTTIASTSPSFQNSRASTSFRSYGNNRNNRTNSVPSSLFCRINLTFVTTKQGKNHTFLEIIPNYALPLHHHKQQRK